MRSAAVLGAGTMGAQIAAHLTNAGLQVVLLDVTDAAAREGLRRAGAMNPRPFFLPENASAITLGSFDNMRAISACDWIIEAVLENPDAKRTLLNAVETHRGPGAIVSSNTSGIPIADLAQGRSPEFRRHFLGTHFFNPPRYLPLLEVIPTEDTDRAVVDRVARFCDVRLGKGVVIARDTPNFIANRIGTFSVVRILDAFAAGGWTVEEIDEITGPVLGRPKSATFRTLDIVGVDVVAHVLRNLQERLPEADGAPFRMPSLLAEMEARNLLGEKTAAGFYQRAPRADRHEILALDPATFEYRPRARVALPAIEAARNIGDTAARVRRLFHGPDRVGAFLRETLGAVLVYTARVTPDIANSIDDVDWAMRWGFGWELGPFELWDALGIADVLQACDVTEVPPLVQMALDRTGRFREGPLRPPSPELLLLRSSRDEGRVVKRNAGASLVDVGEHVLCVEFSSKLNLIGPDAGQMLIAGVQEAQKNFAALVVANEAPNFSAGANLMLLLLEAQEGNWDEIELLVRGFQNANLALQYATVPVIAAPAGLVLGGGCEIVLHADGVQAAAETYIGLVESGVGLIPAGGGSKEMAARSCEGLADPLRVDLLPHVQRAFETVALARVSTSADDARRMGLLRASDRVTMNRGRLVHDARQAASLRAAAGYQPPRPRRAIVVGGEPVRAGLELGIHLAWRAGRISDYDKLIAKALATVMTGGALPRAAAVTEQYLLDLEREAFLRLLGERRTLERIQHMLKTGKPLRN